MYVTKTRYRMNKNVIRWNASIHGREVIIILYHNPISGKRCIVIDGNEVLNKKKFIDNGDKYKFRLWDSHNLEIKIKPNLLNFSYRCVIDNIKITIRDYDKIFN